MDLLPDILWSEIFIMDPTYKNYMTNHVLPFIHSYKVFTKKSKYSSRFNYIIIDNYESQIVLTDNLVTPSFISFNYNMSKETIHLYQNLESLIISKKIIQRLIDYNF